MASEAIARFDFELEDVGKVGWVMWDRFADTTDVGGVELPNEFNLRLPGLADQPSLTIRYEVRAGQPFCASVHFDAKLQGREVNTVDLEIVRRLLSDWTHGVITTVSGEMTDDDTPVAAHAAINRRPKRRKMTERLLREVAALYREHIEDQPWRKIAKHYGVTEATAGRYIVLARQAGYLPPTTPGQKKA